MNDDKVFRLEKHFLEATDVPMLAVDVKGRITDVNPATLHLSRMTREQWVGTDFLSHFVDRRQAQKVLEQALAETSLTGAFLGTIFSDGRVANLELHLNCVRDAGGEIVGIFIEAHDVTGIKAVERRLSAASNYARSLLEASLDPLVTISTDGKIMDVNRATENATGCGREALIGSDFCDYFTEPEKARAGYKQVFSQGHVMGYPLVLRHASGTLMDVLYNASVYHDEEGHVAGVFAAARDVTALKRSQQKLESTTREVVLLGQMTGLLQSCRTVEESLPIVSATMTQLFPEASGRLFLLPSSGGLLESATHWGMAAGVSSALSPADCWALRRGHLHDIGFEPTINPPCRHIDAGDKPYICIPLLAQGMTLGVIHLLIDRGELDEVARLHYRNLAATAADSISLGLANLRLRESLHELSIRDPLTGLYNRRFMEEALAREISRMTRADKYLTVAMIDVDHFKLYNDTHGHDAGDSVLRELGSMMLRFREGSDLACRYGGEEFLLILPGLGPEDALVRLDAFRESVSSMVAMSRGKPLPKITVSIGVASYPANGIASEALIRAADDALYRAKDNGRNRVETSLVGKGAGNNA